MATRSLYDLLDLRPTASDEQVRAAYRLAARRSHPDAGGSEAEFQRVNAAYRVLCDPDRRHRYDLQLASSLDPAARPGTAPRPTHHGRQAVPRPDARARRAYYLAMAVCLTLFVLAAAVVRLYSVPGAFAMMMVAAVIPPVAAFAVNRVPPDRN